MSTRTRSLFAKAPGLGLLATLLLALSITSFGQSDISSISGFVKDQTGSVVAGAKVSAKSDIREFERTTTSNTEGYYIIPNLQPGLYTITVEASGFKQFKATGKKLDPNIASKMDVTLEPGALTDTVNITASTAAVQSETATVGKLVEGKQIELLQLNGRNPLFLAALKPGVSSGGSLSRFSFGLDSGGFNVNGARAQDTLITFDGAVGIRTRSNGTSIGVADLDSTQEIQILTANYNAEYGRSAGGQIRIVTRSGTKDFHGNIYEYIRNSALNANDWSRNRNTPANQPCDNPSFEKASHCRPNPFRYNQFGYSLSGPVIIPGTSFNSDRSKVFWLWGQEWIRFRQGANSTSRVPTLKMRQGDFSELLTSNPFFSTPQYIRDPLKTGTCSAADQTACFPGNIIPANRVSPNGLGLLRAYPEPVPGFSGTGGANYFIERPATTDQRKDTLSIDIYPNEEHSIRWRMALYHYTDNSGLFGSFDRAPRIFDRPNQSASFNWTWTLTPTLISEVLLAASRDQVFIGVDTSNGAFRRGQYGINYPYIFPDRKEIPEKIPTIEINSFATVDGGPYPAQSTGPIYQVNNNWTNIRGNHTIKFGGYFERAGQNDFDQINVAGTPGGTNNQNGRFVFINGTPGGTGLAIANAALGRFDTYAEIGARSFTPYRGHMFEWFVQDSWKATPKLRLEFGLRHTIIQPYYSLWRNMVVFDEKYYDRNNVVTQNPANGFITGGDIRARYNGLVIPGDSWPPSAQGRVPLVNDPNFGFLFRGEDKQYSDINFDNFQPRIGFAYALNDKTVIRAGMGRFITRLGVSDSVFLGGNPPLQPTASVTFGSVDNPGGVGSNAFPLVITTQERKFRMPEAWTWNAMFEREVGFNTTIEVGYVGRRGLHGQRERNLNQLQTGERFLAANAGKNVDVLRPYKGFGIIRVTGNEANSTYHGFQVGANRRFSQGLGFGVAYTLSKSEDDGSAQRDVIPNAYDASTLWGPSDFDRRHVLVVYASWQLPIFKDQSKWTGKVLGGWTLSGTSQWQSGTPFSIGFGDDDAGVGPGSGGQFAIVKGDPILDGSDRKFASNNSDNAYWFRTTNADGTAIFSRPPQGTFNPNRVRNLIYRPGLQSHNIGLFKDFSITERHRITFRAEAFNWLNHPNWNTPDTNPRNATFGKVTSKGDFTVPRQLQFALRYQF